MNNVLLLIFCILAGLLVKRTTLFNDRIPVVLNKIIIYFFFPLIALYQIPKIDLKLSLLWLTLSPFIVFGLSFLFFNLIEKIFALERNTKAALILTSGISSTSFVGFPIFEMLYGAEGLAYGVMLSLGGTVLVFNTVGVSTLFFYTEGNNSFSAVLKKMFTFVPFLAFLLALFFNLINLVYPAALDDLLAILVAPFSIIALLSIGMQIDIRISKELLQELMVGHFFKLVLAPLVLFVLTWHLLDMKDNVGRVSILGAGIGSMNAISILAAERGLNPKLSILMPAIGIPLSIPLLFLIDQLLK